MHTILQFQSAVFFILERFGPHRFGDYWAVRASSSACDYVQIVIQTNLTFHLIYISSGDWKKVKIAIDPEITPLEVKTDSITGSNDLMHVKFITSDGDSAGGVSVRFNSNNFGTHDYSLESCIWPLKSFPSLPTTVNKIWRIRLIKTSVIKILIHCNNVEVLNLILSDTTCNTEQYSYWRTVWSRDVKWTHFYSGDSATDYYRPGPAESGEYIVIIKESISWSRKGISSIF